MKSIEATIIMILSFAGFRYLDEIVKEIRNTNKKILYAYAAIIAVASLYGFYLSLKTFKDI